MQKFFLPVSISNKPRPKVPKNKLPLVKFRFFECNCCPTNENILAGRPLGSSAKLLLNKRQ